jgi:tripartite-type tricarboxylate transporter receptor subunit TctC
MKMLPLTRLLAAAAFASVLSAPVSGQGFPSKPVRVILPVTPGGATDVITRMLAEKMSVRLGQPVIVENRPGAGGVIGADAVLKSPADGYTMGLVLSPALISGLLNGREWKMEEMTPIGLNFRQGLFIGINPQQTLFRGASTLADMIRVVKANSGKVNFGSIGVGSTGHLLGERMKGIAGLDWEHVAYKGGAELTGALVAGNDPFVVIGVTLDDSLRNPDRVKIVATSAPRRHPGTNFPTLTESGYPTLEATTWGGYVAPGGLPAPVRDRLAAEYKAAFDSPDVQEKANRVLLQEYMAPAEFGQLIRDTVTIWGKVIRDSNIKP